MVLFYSQEWDGADNIIIFSVFFTKLIFII